MSSVYSVDSMLVAFSGFIRGSSISFSRFSFSIFASAFLHAFSDYGSSSAVPYVQRALLAGCPRLSAVEPDDATEEPEILARRTGKTMLWLASA